MATIHIVDLALRTIIGIHDWERGKKQDIIINISIDFDASTAIESDNINDTVDYKKMKQDILAFVEQSEFQLLEKLANQVLDIILKDSKVLSATVRIDKPNALRFAKSVAVELSRKRGE